MEGKEQGREKEGRKEDSVRRKDRRKFHFFPPGIHFCIKYISKIDAAFQNIFENIKDMNNYLILNE